MLAAVVQDLMDLQTPLRSDPATERTADAIATISGSIEAAWRSDNKIAGEIPVPLPRKKGIHPRQASMTEASVAFRFFVPKAEARIEDVFSEVQVCVRGTLVVKGMHVELEDHWRIDTHVEQGGDPNESHPIFHFQRGGHAQDTFAADERFVPGPALSVSAERWRGLMQYPGPRIAVVPMCPTAAIDFVLSQHDGTVWRRLMNNPEYYSLVERCQDRLWHLYATALSDTRRRKWLLGYIRRV